MTAAAGGRVLVTGATGGLGLAVAAAFLAEGREVRASGRNPDKGARLAALGAEFVPGDIVAFGVAESLCAGCSAVVHAAGLSATWAPRGDFMVANLGSTRALLGAAVGAGCGRFVYVSSPSVFAAMRDRVGIRDDEDPAGERPLGEYARSKLAAERLVLGADRDGFRTVAVRPRAVVGPDDATLLPRLAAMADRGVLPVMRGGRALVELTDVRDAARAMVLAERHADAAGGLAVNVSGGVPVGVGDLAGLVAGALGKDLRRRALPMPFARAMAAAGEALAARRGREPWLTRYALATMAYSQTFDMARARDLLGYGPRHDALATLLEAARGHRR